MFKKSILIFCCLFLIVTGCVNHTTDNTKQPIKIGFIAPLSGDVTNYGLTEKNSIALAIEEINNSEVGGKLINVIYEDGKCNNKDAVTAVQKLLQIDDVKIILGGFCSTETLSIIPITEESKIILFSSSSSNPQLSDIGEYFFRNCPKDTVWVPAAADTIFESGLSSLAIITEINDYTLGMAEIFKNRFLKRNGEIFEEQIKEGDLDIKTVITKIKQTNAGAIFLNTISSKSSGTLAKQIKQLGVDLPIYGTYVWSSSEAVEIAGDAAEGVLFFDAATLPNKNTSHNFLNNYKNKFGDPANEMIAALRYDSVYIIRDALLECGEETDCIKDYLYNLTEYDGTAGTYGFDENGDVVGIGFVVKQIRDGKPVIIE